MQNKKHKFTAITIGGLWGSSLLGWLMLDRAIAHTEGAWLWATLCFSLAIAFVCVSYLSLKVRLLRGVALGGVFLPSVFFVGDIQHGLWVVAGALITCLGLRRIQEDVDSRVTLKLSRSLYLGIIFVTAGLSLAVSTHYYFRIRTLPLEELLPRFEMGQASGQLIMRGLTLVNPGLKQVDREDLRVDEFIVALEKSGSTNEKASDFDGRIMTKGTALEQELMLQQTRRKFSEAVGRELSGQERVYDVLEEWVNRKMKSYSGSSENMSFAVIPLVLATVLFLTLVSVGSLFRWVWIGLAAGMFWASVKAGALTVRKVTVQKDTIE
jgi:hypothetical protein